MLAAVPAAATAVSSRPIFQVASFHIAKSDPPMAVPAMIATSVLISIRPLARERSRAGSISGTMPYFAGLKKVDRSAIRNTTPSINSMRPEKKARNPSSITRISNAFVTISTRRLLKASAACPA